MFKGKQLRRPDAGEVKAMTAITIKRNGRVMSRVATSAWLIMLLAHPAAAWRQAGGGEAVRIDAAGDVIAAGVGEAGPGTHFSVSKLNGATGAELWGSSLDGTASGEFNRAVAVAIDGNGDVIAAGELTNTDTHGDFAVVKLDGATGSELWRYEVDGTNQEDVAWSVAVNGVGDVYAAGEVDHDFAVVKLDGGTGLELWRYLIDGTKSSPDYDRAVDVTVDSGGNAIAVGTVENLITSHDFVVVKLASATGAELWRDEIDGTFDTTSALHGPPDGAWRVVLDGNEDVIAAGSLVDVTTGQNFAVVKLEASDGAELWRAELNGTDNTNQFGDTDRALSVVVDGDGDVLSAGYLDNQRRNHDFTVVKLAGATGSELWRSVLDGKRNAYPGDEASDLVVDADGNAFAAGAFQFAGRHDQFGVVKLDADTGATLWQQMLDGRASGVAALSGGDVVATGYVVEGPVTMRLGGLDGAIGPIAGQHMLVIDNAENSAKRHLAVSSTSANIATAAPGSAGDPSLYGAKLRLLNPGSGESASLSLPAGSSWVGLGTPAGTDGYKYVDRSGANGPCRSLIAHRGHNLKAVCRATTAPIPFSLDETTQGSLIVSIQLGSAAPQCMWFGGTVTRDAGTANPGPQGIFGAKRAPVFAGDCPAP